MSEDGASARVTSILAVLAQDAAIIERATAMNTLLKFDIFAVDC